MEIEKRYAVIGAGAGIFNSHRAALRLPGVKLVAVCEVNVERGQAVADEFQCAFYADYRQMLSEIRPDVAVILTPPFLHASMAIDCLQAGCHVLIEKPIAIQVAEADAMVEAARQSQRLLGVIFQHRFRPEIIAARKLLREGLLGQIQRVELLATWPRPHSYFALAAWRATWKGEGGGILTNQGSHHLDLLCHLLGQPARLYAWTRRLLHQIETEDTAHAMLEWADGALGTVHLTTAEADLTERFKIVGTGGFLEIGRKKLDVTVFEEDLRDYRVNCTNPYAPPRSRPYPVVMEEGQGNHVAVYQNFQAAILHDEPLEADGLQGNLELELANAITYSSYTHREIELPLDRQQYANLLAELSQNA